MIKEDFYKLCIGQIIYFKNESEVVNSLSIEHQTCLVGLVGKEGTKYDFGSFASQFSFTKAKKKVTKTQDCLVELNENKVIDKLWLRFNINDLSFNLKSSLATIIYQAEE